MLRFLHVIGATLLTDHFKNKPNRHSITLIF